MRSTQEIADQILQAMGDADLVGFEELLDPDVTWGAPDDPAPHCRNRAEVLTWYRRSLGAGVRSWVSEMQVAENQIVLSLEVSGRTADVVERWQVLTVRDGLIVTIVGFDDRAAAMDRARRGDGGES